MVFGSGSPANTGVSGPLGPKHYLTVYSTIKGTIQSIDIKGESFKLKTDDKKVVEYKADPVLLEDLKPGDLVLVTIDEKEIVAISLDKKEED